MIRRFIKWLRKRNALEVLGLAVLLFLIFAPIWLALISYGQSRIRTSDYWAVAEGLSSAASFVAVLAGGIVIIVQLVESVDSRHMSIFDETFNRMMDRDETEARRWIIQDMRPFPTDGSDPAETFKEMDKEEHWHVKRVLNSFDHLGFMLEQGWMTDTAIIGWVSPMVVKVWRKLGPYIEYEADRRAEPDYYSGARYLADQCRRWRGAGDDPKIVDDAL